MAVFGSMIPLGHCTSSCYNTISQIIYLPLHTYINVQRPYLLTHDYFSYSHSKKNGGGGRVGQDPETEIVWGIRVYRYLGLDSFSKVLGWGLR